MAKMIKKELMFAIVLLLLIPAVLMLGGALFSFINPEIGAGHPNYARNFLLLNQLKKLVIWGTAATVVALWVMVCLQMIRAKGRSAAWLVLAALGPFGLAGLAMLNDAKASDATKANEPTAAMDRYSRFVGKMHWLVRVGYEAFCFMIAWTLAYEGMVLRRSLMIRFEAARSGMSVAQVIDVQNASGGMWAFSEGLEVMFLVVLFYLLRPVMFNLVGRLVATKGSPRPAEWEQS